MALTATLDKAIYSPGDTATLTIVSDKRIAGSTTLDIVTAGEDFKVGITVFAPVRIADSTGRVWTQKSDDGKTAVYTATA